MKNKITFKDIKAWFTGKYRYKLYYSVNWGWLMRTHIREQIDWRIKIMDKECYSQGSCIMCGCQTTALQMANKACDKPCYPKMASSITWQVQKTYLIQMQEVNPELFYKEICGN